MAQGYYCSQRAARTWPWRARALVTEPRLPRNRRMTEARPPAAEAARLRAPERPDLRWRPALRLLGYHDVATYLRERHLEQHQTVNAIAAETGLSQNAVRSALRRHGLASVAHAAKRHAARQREAEVAACLGYATIVGYISNRRSRGWTWKAISAESGQPETWLRRHAAGPGNLARLPQEASASVRIL
jgi:AraC-like DNA-binding protein